MMEHHWTNIYSSTPESHPSTPESHPSTPESLIKQITENHLYLSPTKADLEGGYEP